MDPDVLIKKNLDLHTEWIRYLFEHPEMMDEIPEGAQVVIMPTDDPPLAQANAKTLTAAKQRGIPVVVVHMSSPKHPTPQIEVVAR